MFMLRSAIFAIGTMLSIAQGAWAVDMRVDPDLVAEGAPLYMEHCAVCHGAEGDGKGPLASGFSPAPRDFSQGSFKLKTTGVGEPPSESDLVKTIRNGITGSYGQSMPAFDFFSDRELRALAEVIRYVAEFDAFGNSIDPPLRPKTVDLAWGEALYQVLRCAGCHGDDGNGQGELAVELEDVNGHPIKPADFRVGQFKGGNTPEDIWMRIYAGLDGTPMPAFGRNTSPSDIWAVTEYVLTLRNEE